MCVTEQEETAFNLLHAVFTISTGIRNLKTQAAQTDQSHFLQPPRDVSVDLTCSYISEVVHVSYSVATELTCSSIEKCSTNKMTLFLFSFFKIEMNSVLSSTNEILFSCTVLD